MFSVFDLGLDLTSPLDCMFCHINRIIFYFQKKTYALLIKKQRDQRKSKTLATYY